MAAVLLLAPISAQAAGPYTWKVASGLWSTAANWTNGVPTSGVNSWTYVNNGGTCSATSGHPVCYNLDIGTTAGAGTVLVSGALTNFAVTNNIYVGDTGVGTCTQSGGEVGVYSGNLVIGNASTGNGTYNLSDPGILIPGSAEVVGNLGTGYFIQSGGTNADVQGSGDYLSIGGNVGNSSGNGTGTYTLNGDGVLEFDTEYVGNSGASVGTVNQIGGSNTVGALILGNSQTNASNVSQGTYNLSGGTLNTTSLTLAYQGKGTFTQSGGTHIVAGAISFATGAASLPSQGIYNLNAGTLQLQGGMNNDAGGTGMFNLGGGTLQATASFDVDHSLPITFTGNGGNGTIDTQGYAVEFDGNIAGPAGFTKLGSGTLTLTGNNSYSGLTTVQAGTLWLNVLGGAAAPILTGGGANVQGGTLVFDYTNTADPVAAVRSALQAGCRNGWASGQIYSSTAAATTGWDLGYWDNGSQVTVKPTLPGDAIGNGQVDINDLTIVLTNYNQSVGMSWATGDFLYDGTVDINDLTIVLTNYNQTIGSAATGLAAVPEPSMMALFAAGLAGLLAFAWRKRK